MKDFCKISAAILGAIILYVFAVIGVLCLYAIPVALLAGLVWVLLTIFQSFGLL